MGRGENFSLAGKRANGVKCLGGVWIDFSILRAASNYNFVFFAMKRLDFQFWPAPAHFSMRLDGARYLDNGASRGLITNLVASRAEHAIRSRDAYGFRHWSQNLIFRSSSRPQNPTFCSVPGPQSL